MDARYSRQARLVEVGAGGQARIARARVFVRGGGLSAEVEARYLVGAGVANLDVEDDRAARRAHEVDARAELRIRPLSTEDDPAGDQGRDPGWISALATPAQEVARGAHRALRALRRAIEAQP